MADDTTGKTPEQEPEERPADHHIKDDVRGAVARVVGIAVEAGSMLAGQSGELVTAEREKAESDTEEFIDRIDGEG